MIDEALARSLADTLRTVAEASRLTESHSLARTLARTHTNASIVS
jgi:hypothetical protein